MIYLSVLSSQVVRKIFPRFCFHQFPSRCSGFPPLERKRQTISLSTGFSRASSLVLAIDVNDYLPFISGGGGQGDPKSASGMKWPYTKLMHRAELLTKRNIIPSSSFLPYPVTFLTKTLGHPLSPASTIQRFPVPSGDYAPFSLAVLYTLPCLP